MAPTPPAMRHWEDFPLDKALSEAARLPVVLDNDATAAALGEHWSGVVGTTATFAAVYMGTGIGTGLMIDGVMYRGASGNAGEIGHICLDAAGPVCWCGARGCTEALAGPAAVVAEARTDARLARVAGLDDSGDQQRVVADFAALTRVARRGDSTARGLLERSARYLAVASRTLANIMDLELLVLTGPSLGHAGSIYLPVVRDELDKSFFARAAHPIDVKLSTSAAAAPAIGAATLVLQTELVPLREPLRLPEELGSREPAPASVHGG
jgi:predicted NBD/HSP70 family sugar kinase